MLDSLTLIEGVASKGKADPTEEATRKQKAQALEAAEIDDEGYVL